MTPERTWTVPAVRLNGLLGGDNEELQMRYPKKLYSAEERAWCELYKRTTTFDPAEMEQYEAGDLSFHEAAKASVAWFRDWAEDAAQAAERNVPGSELDLAMNTSIVPKRPDKVMPPYA